MAEIYQRLAHYTIVEKIGSGGMGEVYLAEDTRLERKVALKVLPPGLAEDAERRTRFQREARAIAALNHPNIVHVYSVEEAHGVHFITMEHVSGHTLSRLIPKSGMTLAKFLDIAIPLADALVSAHDGGIVHRDLKPSNVMVTEEGRVKVLDFGLAKVEHDSVAASQLPTQSATGEGRFLGTVAYMSPEQAEGKPVDHRTDLFSLGTVFYEMATGQRPFAGDSPASVLSAILRDTPASVTDINHLLPRDIARIIRRCLAKNPEQRYQTAKDLRSDLQEVRRDLDSGQPFNHVAPVRASGWTKRSAAVLMLVAAPAAALAGFLLYQLVADSSRQRPAPASHVQITFTGKAFRPAVSPDGSFVAYVAVEPGLERVMLQDLSGGQPLEVFRAKAVSDVKWTRDGSELLVGALVRVYPEIFSVPRLGRSSRRVGTGARVSSSADGHRLATAYQDETGFRVVDKNSGAEARVSLTGFQWLDGLEWSPSDDRLLLQTMTSGKHELWTVKVDGAEQTRIIEEQFALASPVWSADGNAVYYLRFVETAAELVKLDLTAPSRTPKVLQSGFAAGPTISMTADGRTLFYTRSVEYSNLWMASVSADTLAETRQLTEGTLHRFDPAFSPNGESVAFVSSSSPASFVSNLFGVSVRGGAAQQLTFSESRKASPAWSPDGTRLAFGSQSGERMTIEVMGRGGGPSTALAGVHLSESLQLTWSPGAVPLYQRSGNRNVSLFDPVSRTETKLVQDDSVGWMFDARYAPDGTTVAAYWNRRDRGLWIIPLSPGAPHRVTDEPLSPIGWTPDGSGIYAYYNDREQNRVVLVPSGGGPPKDLVTFPGSVWGGSVSPDGRTFVVTVGASLSDVWRLDDFDPERRVSCPPLDRRLLALRERQGSIGRASGIMRASARSACRA